MFNRWSIKAKLQVLAFTTIIFVLVIGAIGNFTHKIVETTQDSFSLTLLPLANFSRELNNALTQLINRQKQVLTATTRDELESVVKRDEHTKHFQSHLDEISRILDESDTKGAFTKAIQRFYEDFLSLDDELLELKKNFLDQQQLLSIRQQDIRIQFGKLENTFDLTESAFQTSGSRNAINLLKRLRQLQKEVELLSYQMIDLDEGHNVQHLDKAVFKPLSLEMLSQLEAIEKQLFRVSDKNLLAELDKDVKVILDLIGGEQGLVSTQVSRALSELLLKQTSQSIAAVTQVLMEQLGTLAELVDHNAYESVSESANLLEQMRWKVLAVGFFLTITMMAFIYSLIRSINQSLTSIRQGMHALSEGKFETRLPASATKDELNNLVADFNQFAENTEQLISDFANARESIEKQEQHLRTILNGVPEAILTLSPVGDILGCNPAAEDVLKASQGTLIGERLTRFFSDADMAVSVDKLAETVQKSREFKGQTYTGQPINIQVSLSKINRGEGYVWVCVISDVTLLKETDLQLHKTTSELNAILDNAMVGIALIRDRTFVRVNHKFEELFQVRREVIEGQSTSSIYPNQQAYEQFGREAYAALSEGLSYEAQVEMVRQNGQSFWCALAGKIIDYSNIDQGTIWLFEDVTQQRENEEHLTQLASIDTLTGLPNRAVFNDRLEHAIHKAHRSSGRLAVFFLDLDHFKMINDSLGHKVGDMLLIEVARRIKSCLREGDTVARLGGDEFTLVLEDVKSAEFVGKVAEKVLQATSKPYMLDGTEINISPSIGISLYPADGRDLDMLLRNADAAMYHAKKHGRNNFQFYSAEMNAEAAERLAMETALRKAVEQREFYLNFQPQINLHTGKIEGAEALIRWKSAHWGDVSPAKFVPILEDTGLIGTVGEWVLMEACHFYVEIADKLPIEFKMAVNLSGRQFKGGNLSNKVNDILNEAGMSAANLELEITESMLMEDTQLAIATLRELSANGINLAVDDFGTGYSSLSYLKQFPLNVLKIDGTFVRDITNDVDDAAIVDAIMAMSKSLQLQVVAEGVETQEQLAFLMERQCNFAQGYYFSRPIDKEAFKEFINQPVKLI